MHKKIIGQLKEKGFVAFWQEGTRQYPWSSSREAILNPQKWQLDSLDSQVIEKYKLLNSEELIAKLDIKDVSFWSLVSHIQNILTVESVFRDEQTRGEGIFREIQKLEEQAQEQKTIIYLLAQRLSI